MIRWFFSIAFAALLTQAQFVRGDLVVTAASSSASYNVGDTGSVSVFVYSTNAPNDALDGFLFNLNIAGGGGVEFADPQDESFLLANNYVFFQRSANIAFSFPATSVSNAGATLTMADVSYDFTPGPTLGNALPRTILDSSSPFLLGTFSFVANAAGNYTIGLDPSSSFSDASFATFVYTSNPANFVVTAVPEPSGLWLVSISLVCLTQRRHKTYLQRS